MNSLSYHESHSHGSLGLPFQAYSQEDPYGQYFVPYHWHEEVEFIYVTKGSLVLRTQNRTRLLQEGHIYFINPGTLHGLFGNSPFSHHYALVFRLDMLNFLQTDSCKCSYFVRQIHFRQIPARPLIWYLFAPENICFPIVKHLLRNSLLRLLHS